MAERPHSRDPAPGAAVAADRATAQTDIPPADAGRRARRIGPQLDWRERALGNPEVPGQLRDDPSAIVPERAPVLEGASEVLDRVTGRAMRYRAASGEVPPADIRDVLSDPDGGLVALDHMLMLRPQSMVSGPAGGDREGAPETVR